jgi:flagellar M-ring protein FliF
VQSIDNRLPGMSNLVPVLESPIDPEKAESEILKDRILTLIQDDTEKASGALSLWLVRRDI